MANLKKQCNECGKSFEATTEFFHRNKAHKDGLLTRCKSCQNKKTAEYRIGDGKNYWFDENGKDGWFRIPNNRIKWQEYLKENFTARFNCKIYGIVNPEGMVYIGHTRYPSIGWRMSRHRNDYNSWKIDNSRRNAIPYLYDSFNKWGLDKHTTILIEELPTDDKSVGLKRESEYIEQYMNKGISLNKKIK